MKNSKREITLNECDSISDMLFLEKSLMREYCTAVFSAKRKEERTYLTDSLASVAEDIFFLQDLLDSRREEKIKKCEN